jgi:hypothetical protein
VDAGARDDARAGVKGGPVQRAEQPAARDAERMGAAVAPPMPKPAMAIRMLSAACFVDYSIPDSSRL